MRAYRTMLNDEICVRRRLRGDFFRHPEQQHAGTSLPMYHVRAAGVRYEIYVALLYAYI
jgi:hypothetical protein